MAVCVAFPLAVRRAPAAPRPHRHLASTVSVFWPFSQGAVVSRRCFNVHFPDDVGCGASFRVLLFRPYGFSGEASVKVLGPSLIRLFGF